MKRITPEGQGWALIAIGVISGITVVAIGLDHWEMVSALLCAGGFCMINGGVSTVDVLVQL